MNNDLKKLCDNTCMAKLLRAKLSLPKKDKCCKNYKDGKRCKRCPKR